MAKRAKGRITIYDVAKKAGVSITTVSNVIHNKTNIPPSTKKRVQKVMQSLNYVPNIIAQRLVTRRTQIVSLLIPSINNPFFADLYDGIERYLNEKAPHYRIQIGNTLYSTDREAELIQSFRREYVDGFIIVSNDPSSSEIAQLRKERIPFVFSINDIHSVADDPLVTYNNYEMAYTAASYLLDLGHKRFGYIAGLFGESDRPQARFNGFQQALRDKGVRFYKKHFVIGGSYSSEAGFFSCQKLFSSPGERPTALFCANDLIAVGAMHALQKQGLTVPADVSIVGFDNIQPSAYVSPPLTTIGVKISEVGYESARLLFQILNREKPEKRQITISGKLIVRESCAPVS